MDRIKPLLPLLGVVAAIVIIVGSVLLIQHGTSQASPHEQAGTSVPRTSSASSSPAASSSLTQPVENGDDDQGIILPDCSDAKVGVGDYSSFTQRVLTYETWRLNNRPISELSSLSTQKFQSDHPGDPGLNSGTPSISISQSGTTISCTMTQNGNEVVHVTPAVSSARSDGTTISYVRPTHTTMWVKQAGIWKVDEDMGEDS
jgi:hypothetical protein